VIKIKGSIFWDSTKGQEIPAPEAIKRIRKERNLAPEELGLELGVKKGTINNWEQGRRKVPVMAIKLLAHLWGGLYRVKHG